MITKHLIITGRVQGVGFRNYIDYKAKQFGAKGWVRNRRDGTVEAMFQGPPETVDAMIACARRGPRASEVTDVAVSEGIGEFSRFDVLPTE